MNNLLSRVLSRIRNPFGANSVQKLYEPYDRSWAKAFSLNISDDPLQYPYNQHPWVHACVATIMTRVSSVPFRLYRGSRESKKVIESGPLYDIFKRPNSQWSEFCLWEASTAHLQLDGNTLLVLDRRRPEAVPVEMWAFGRSRFDPIFRKGSRDIKAWEFKYDADDLQKTRRLQPWQVVWTSLYNPYSDFWGVGPWEAARAAAENDWLAMAFNRSFFENCANPGGILKVKEHISKEQRESYKSQFNDVHAGAWKGFKTALLEGDVEYIQNKVSLEDMLFIEQRKYSREEIAATFKVPPSEIGVFERVHKATADGIRKQFWEGTILPLLKLYEAMLNAQFLSPLGVWGRFDLSGVDVLQEDRDIKVDRSVKLKGMGIPFYLINEIEDLGYPRFEGDNVGHLPVNLRPLDVPYVMPGTNGQNQVEEEPKTVEEASFQVVEEKRLLPQPRDHGGIQYESDEHVKVYTEFVNTLTESEQTFEKRLRTFFQKINSYFSLTLTEGLERYGSIVSLPENLLELTRDHQTQLRTLSSAHYRKVNEAIGPLIEAHITNVGIPFTYRPDDPRLIEFLKTKEIKLVGDVTGTLSEAVRSRLVKGKNSGATVNELAESIVGLVKNDKARALKIARTETAQAANGLEFESQLMAGVTKHQWIAALDERTRLTHADNMNLGPYPVRAVYPNGCRYPGDMTGPREEIISCRCTIIAVE